MTHSRKIPGIDTEVTSIGLGTWLMNGFHWGDAEDAALEQAVEESLDTGLSLIDTAPVYGFGRSEELIGRVIKRLGKRNQILLATKFGLAWDENKITIRRNSTKKNLMRELDKSRRRLQTDVIDLYQVHWPDLNTEMGETMDALLSFYDAGIIRAIGVSNFNIEQVQKAMRYAPIHACQLPLNLFEQGSAVELIPFCKENNIAVLAYSPLCRGLLSGKYTEGAVFLPGDIRAEDPKFKGAAMRPYLKAVSGLKEFALFKKCTAAQLALSWVIHTPGVCTALAGARSRQQMSSNAAASQVVLSPDDWKTVGGIVKTCVPQCATAQPLDPPF
ncbi:MAG: aldo/keto reductase [Candidatus Omnitrophica bacterium]|nr:aldo/keto reductase [Candidatus Omnitrophota bacterium]